MNKMNDTCELSDSKKRLLINKIYAEAEIYSHFINKTYLFIVEDGSDYIGKFLKEDFIHLTGVTVSDDSIFSRFYDLSINKQLEIGNIKDKQTHTYKTINKKHRLLVNLVSFVENNDDKDIIISDPSTQTNGNFKYALRDDNRKYTILFANRDNARSSRLEGVALGNTRKKIIAIFYRTNDSHKFHNLCYLDNRFSILDIYNLISDRYTLLDQNTLIKK